MTGERVEIGVRRGVVGLTRRAEHRRSRRVEDEELEGSVERQLVEVSRAVDLRREHPFEPRFVEVREDAVIEHPRGVHDAGQRRQLGGHRRHQVRDVVRVGHIGGAHPDGGAVLRKIWKERWTFSGCGSATTITMTFTPDGKGGTSFSASGN